MIRKEFFAVCCLVLSASAKAEVEFCHQNTLESVYDREWHQDAPDASYEVGYSCKGNSGVIFTYEGNRWVSSQGAIWEITGEWAATEDAKKICADMGARLPSEREFQNLTYEMKSPVTHRIAPIFGLRPDAKSFERFWIGDDSANYMRYVWDPRSGATHGRYFSDSAYPVVCKH